MIKDGWENNRLILFVNPASTIGLKEMECGVNSILERTDLPDELLIIENASSSKVNFKANDVMKINAWVNIMAQKFKKVKHALITQSPDATALALLIINAVKVKNYHIEVFSTEAAARKWLN